MSTASPVNAQASPATPRPRRSCLVFGIVATVSIVAGLASSFVPWKHANGAHGTGFPIPLVIWEKRPGSDHFVDYPAPLALVLNPLAFLLAAGVLWACWTLLRRILGR